MNNTKFYDDALEIVKQAVDADERSEEGASRARAPAHSSPRARARAPSLLQHLPPLARRAAAEDYPNAITLYGRAIERFLAGISCALPGPLGLCVPRWLLLRHALPAATPRAPPSCAALADPPLLQLRRTPRASP